MLPGRLLVEDWYCGHVLYMFDLCSWQFSGVYVVVEAFREAVQLCYSEACFNSCLCNICRAGTARDLDISFVFHDTLFLAVISI
jgi:hypothetical protein